MPSVPQLCFQVVDLPSAGLEVHERVSFAALGIDADEMVSFPCELHVDLNVSPVGESVLVRGRAWADVIRLCDRCLASRRVRVEAADLCYHVEDVEETVLDLTESLREDILLVLPQHYLCHDECAGLCPRCGQDLNDGSCSCGQEADEDDPWQALNGLDIAPDT